MSNLLNRGLATAAMVAVSGLFALPVQALKCTTEGGLGCQSDDGQFSTEFGGRIMLDLNVFDEDELFADANGDPADQNDDGLEIRRLRFFNEFELYGRYFGKIQITFADEGTTVEDAYVGVKNPFSLPGSLVFGQEKVPYGLNELTSSKYLTFIERSFVTDYVTSRVLGVGHHFESDNFTAFTRVYSPDDTGDTAGGNGGGAGDSDGVGVGSRLTFTPVNEGDKLIHIGGAYLMESNLDDGSSFRRARIRPEAHLAGRHVLTEDSPDSGFDKTHWGLELAGIFGPLSLQGEYGVLNLDDDNGFDQDVEGGYLFASYFLTPGDSRAYKKGAFARVKPKGKAGAWEVAVRYSTAENTDAPSGDLEANTLTFGVNWYANKYVRVMFNYIMPDLDGNAQPQFAGEDNYDGDIFVMRIQADYGD